MDVKTLNSNTLRILEHTLDAPLKRCDMTHVMNNNTGTQGRLRRSSAKDRAHSTSRSTGQLHLLHVCDSQTTRLHPNPMFRDLERLHMGVA